MASIVFSSMLQWKAFQLLQPMGGVAASVAGLTYQASSEACVPGSMVALPPTFIWPAAPAPASRGTEAAPAPTSPPAPASAPAVWVALAPPAGAPPGLPVGLPAGGLLLHPETTRATDRQAANVVNHRARLIFELICDRRLIRRRRI